MAATLGALMAALDNLRPEQFLHASPYRIAKGTVMTPETNAAHGANFEISSGNTYFTTSRKIADNMGMAAMNAVGRRTNQWQDPRGYRVYDVKPLGPYHEDMNGVDWSYESAHPVQVLGRHVYTAPQDRNYGNGRSDFANRRRAMKRAKSMEEY